MTDNTFEDATMEQTEDLEQAEEMQEETTKGQNPMVGFAAGFAAGVGITKIGDKIANKVKTKLAAKKDADSDHEGSKPKKGHLAIRNPFYRKEEPVVEPKKVGTKNNSTKTDKKSK